MRKISNLKHLYYLSTLYEHQHFGRAAQACYVSQSTLSAAISHFEELLGAKLLERDHKTFLFTPLGEEVVRRGRVILKQCDDLAEYVQNQGKFMQGPLYLGIIPTIAPFILNKLQTLCAQQYPQLNLFIREDTTDNVLRYLGEGKLDLVILALPYPMDDMHLHQQPLHKDYFQLVLPKYWQNKGFEEKLGQVPEHSIFLLEKEHCLTAHAIQACALKESKKINQFFATSLHTLVQMVSHQPGITFLPQLAIQNGLLNGTDLVAVPLKNQRAYREIGLVWRQSSYKVKVYEQLLPLIKNVLDHEANFQEKS